MRRPGSARRATALVTGSVLSGLLAYVVFVVATRALGAEQAAPVSVLWSWWGLSGAAVTFPVQHWITHSAEAHGEGAVRQALPRVASSVLVTAALLGAVAAIAREPLFHRSDLWFPVMVALVTVGAALVGVLRGTLTARGRLGAVGASLALENGIRCVLVLALALADVRSPVAYGACLVAGHAVVLLWPRAFLLGATPGSDVDSDPFRFLAGAGFSQLVAQVVLAGGPVVLAATSAPEAQVTSLFAALALFRAPYLLGLGLVGPWNSHVTRLVVADRRADLRRIDQATIAGTVVLALLAAGGAALVGPALLRLVFGGDVRLQAGQATIAAVACTLALANLVTTVTALARRRAATVTRAWTSAVVVAAVALAVVPATPLDRTLWALLAAEAVAFGGLVVSRPAWWPPGTPTTRTAGRGDAGPAGPPR